MPGSILGAIFKDLQEVIAAFDYVRPQRDANLPPATQVVALRIYPIKSCRGIEVPEAKLRMSGLDLDRHWMFVDAADNKFLTIRSNSNMTLIDTAVDWDKAELTISVHGSKDQVTVPSHPSKEWLQENTTLEEVEIWETKTDGWAYSESINATFSHHFKKPVKLIYKGPSQRPAGGSGKEELSGRDVPHMFADLMSVQIASESSLKDLNGRLKERKYKGDELTIERFRPNIIILGNEPWEEDRWKRVQISTIDHEKELLWRVGFDVVCRCARCQVPNVNPDTADKHPHEPWDTLMKFRRVDKGGAAKYKPCFGMLCLPQKEGPIKVGAKFEVMEMTDKHLYNTARFDEL
ncbi:MOSC-domain-containing protein [Myriangium duriaei CBS 260.36]|uniref:MOSC-domain-containing protein n=1 Tax=Myriangium duriaei CBS 260.36 TaxID=1168546 RepID=A0A9P4MJ73_9PEZI|nr:MOSC-domain-containing protein [Myriangium duriaei CBS 260.36]